MLTSYFANEMGEDVMLNRTNFKAPSEQVYIISQWVNPNSDNEWQRTSKSSLSNIIQDVIAYRIDDKYNCILYGAKKLKKIW